MVALSIRRPALLAVIVAAAGLFFGGAASADNNYGAGTYGACQYGSCSITLSSNGAVSLDIVPTASGACTIQSDSVSVLTDNSNGYTLSVSDAAASSALTAGANTIAATPGTFTSPQTLASNKWGYRVDGAGGFGSGPTSGQSSGAASGLAFAGLPTSSQTADTLVHTNGPADPAEVTKIWYGVCANLSTVADTYSTQVVYTATTN